MTKSHNMPTVRVKSDINLGLQEILDGISELETRDLERFMDQVGRLLARRKASAFSGRETELLLKINQGLPQTTWDRYRDLSDKQTSETLSEKEYQELLAISDRMEEQDVKRLASLIELARLRSVPLDTLMQQLGINPSADV